MEKRCSNGKVAFEGLFPLLYCGVVEVGFWQFWKNKKEKKALFAFRGCILRFFKFQDIQLDPFYFAFRICKESDV